MQPISGKRRTDQISHEERAPEDGLARERAAQTQRGVCESQKSLRGGCKRGHGGAAVKFLITKEHSGPQWVRGPSRDGTLGDRGQFRRISQLRTFREVQGLVIPYDGRLEE